jgi:anti-sigma B factor antagonist
MRAHQLEDGGLHIVQLSGEIDLERSPELRALLDSRVKARTPALALDFREVSFIDSSGLATLVEYCRKARDYEGRFAIFGVSERVRTVFEIVRLQEFLGLYDSIDAVRAAWGVSDSASA